MAKPVNKPEWTVGNPDFGTVTQEPSAAKKEAGWLVDERPPREYMNWLFFNVGEWIDYFETVTDTFASQGIIYDAFIGAGGTHVDVNAWQADGDIANLKNAIVVSNLAVDVIQVITQDGSKLDFKADVSITKNGPTGADIGLRINADRVKINQGRFIGFNESAVDKGIEILATKKNNIIHGCLFNDCDEPIDDLGDNNELSANIEEV